MTNHPNRTKPVPDGTPTPDEIKAARAAAGLTQREAAALIWYEEIAWKQWEGGNRRMHPCSWWAFQQRASGLDDRAKVSWRDMGLTLIDVAGIDCPLCHCGVGEYCASSKAHPTGAGFHAERVAAARKARKLAHHPSEQLSSDSAPLQVDAGLPALTAVQQAHLDAVRFGATKVEMEKYLRDGVTVDIVRQTEEPDVPPFAIYVCERQEFWIDCCETREAAVARVKELGLKQATATRKGK